MIRTTRIAIGLLVLQACSSNDPASRPNDSGQASLPEVSQSDLERTLDDVVARGVAPGASLTVAHPKYRTWSGASGVASLETHQALTPAERFRAGSILKMAVAAAVLQLVEQGELSLDAALTDLVPAALAARFADAHSITVRMLLRHTSGIPEFSTPEFDAEVMGDPTHVWTFDEFFDRALARPPLFAPGAGWSYSNTNYILLGAILERTTGEPWRTTVRERVLERAGLADSELPEEGNPRCAGCSRGYHPVEDRIVDVTEIDPSMAGPAGGDALVTTPADLVKLIGALVAGRLFDSPATFELMSDFVDAPIPEEAQAGYGFGLQHLQAGDLELVGHLGGTAGFQGFVLIHPVTGIMASGYINRYGDLGGFILPVLDAIARIE
jgi:D-alanyl-D-alanine carboxypeptidase